MQFTQYRTLPAAINLAGTGLAYGVWDTRALSFVDVLTGRVEKRFVAGDSADTFNMWLTVAVHNTEHRSAARTAWVSWTEMRETAALPRTSMQMDIAMNRFDTEEDADAAADALTAENPGAVFGVFRGKKGFHARRVPQVGEHVSHRIGGDAHYDGRVTKATTTRIEVTAGVVGGTRVFTRRRDGSWQLRGEPYVSMMWGVVSHYDPHF